MKGNLKDRVHDAEYARMANQLDTALKTYSGKYKPKLLKSVDHLKESIKRYGLASIKTDAKYSAVQKTLDLIAIEQDLVNNSPSHWDEEVRKAHIRELMESLIK